MSKKKKKIEVQDPNYLIHPQLGLGIALASVLASSCYQGEIEIAKTLPTSTDIVGKITDNSDVGLANYRVILVNEFGAPVVNSNNEIKSVITNSTGSFSFSNLSHGKYRVIVLPTITPNTSFLPDVVSDPDVVLDGHTEVTIPSLSETIVFKYGGIATTYAPGATYSPALGAFPLVGYEVSGKVYLNKFTESPRSFDGGDGDTGLDRARVLLFDTTGGRVLDVNGRPIEAVTDSSGDYTFSDLQPGSYAVTVVPDPGYYVVYEEQDADFDGFGQVSITGANITGVDFGFKSQSAPSTTLLSTTIAATTPAATTLAVTTPAATTTLSVTTPAATTTLSVTTPAGTTMWATTPVPVTTMLWATTPAGTTMWATTPVPATTMLWATTPAPTPAPTTVPPTTSMGTTMWPTTPPPTTSMGTTMWPTTPPPTTSMGTTMWPTTPPPTTAMGTTMWPTTPPPTTAMGTTVAPTTPVPTTAIPTTVP